MSEFNSRRTPANNSPDYNDRRSPPAFRNTDRRKSPPLRANDRQPSPAYGFGDTDRMTPPRPGPAAAKKIQFSNDVPMKNNRPPLSDEQPYKVFRPESGNPTTKNSLFPSTHGKAEMYFIDAHKQKDVDDDHGSFSDRRSPPIPTRNNVVSPAPYGQSNRLGPEMYHIGEVKENIPVHNPTSSFGNAGYSKPGFNNIDGPRDENVPGKVTVYVLSASDENQRSASPFFPTNKPARYSSPVNEINEDLNYMDNPMTPRPFPTALRTVPSPVNHVIVAQSRATQSIERSMNKYRFLGR